MNRVTDGRCGGYLALVDTGILPLRIPYSQYPFSGAHPVRRLETLVARVRVTADRQQVNVTMPHPRDLGQAGKYFDFIDRRRTICASARVIAEIFRDRGEGGGDDVSFLSGTYVTFVTIYYKS